MFSLNTKGENLSVKSSALDALHGHVMMADAKLNITYINPALAELLGRLEPDLRKELPHFSMATLVGSNVDIFHKNPSHQRELLTSLTKPFSTTIRVGKLIFDLKVSPLGKGTKRTGFVVEWADANERLLNVDYAAQIAAIGRSQAVVEFSTAGIILNANENFLQTMGYALEEIRGKHHSLFVEASFRESQDYGLFWEHLRNGEYQAGEYKRVGKGGREVWIQGAYNPIFDDKGKVTKVVKFATDVTQRVQSVAEIGSALTALSKGRLERRIRQELIPELDKLRTDFNEALNTLQRTMLKVGQTAHAIKGGSEEIRVSSDDLSKRTEQQAASLEETAAALDEITATIKRTAEGARHAQQVVSTAKQDAESSGSIVGRTVEAMNAIETSSRQVSQIIGVIDEIAFQTNLLALNAGVEAARAGEAGRGFAVVASEVRALAQRSAEAAKEINSLITRSNQHVSSGVELVGETGEALSMIVTQVGEISSIIGDIAASAQEQAAALQEVNTAVNQMDQMTQQNAAMVEESTAASHSLAQEASELSTLVGQFEVGAYDLAAARLTSKQVTAMGPIPGKTIARRAQRAASVKGNLALTDVNPKNGWEEF